MFDLNFSTLLKNEAFPKSAKLELKRRPLGGPNFAKSHKTPISNATKTKASKSLRKCSKKNGPTPPTRNYEMLHFCNFAASPKKCAPMDPK